MEHIFEIGINISDEAIKEAAINQVANKIYKEVDRGIFTYSYSRNEKNGLTDSFKDVVKNWLDDHKDEIIKESVTEIVTSIRNSKKYKEAIAEVVEEVKKNASC